VRTLCYTIQKLRSFRNSEKFLLRESQDHSNNYSCKHFTTKWKDGIDPQTKGLAGELQRFEALKIVAKMRNQAAPVLLGEPDDPEMIDRKDNYPDVTTIVIARLGGIVRY
jgi:hypothetical protein